MKQYIVTTRFDDVLHCFCFIFAVVWCICIVMNVSVSYNGGLPLDIIPLVSTTINCSILIILLYIIAMGTVLYSTVVH